MCTTITSAAYCYTLKSLKRGIQNKSWPSDTWCYACAWQRSPSHSLKNKWTFCHVQVGRFWSFPIQPRLGSYQLLRIPEHEAVACISVIGWLHSQAADSYTDSISRTVQRYDQCLNLFGDFVGKCRKVIFFRCI